MKKIFALATVVMLTGCVAARSLGKVGMNIIQPVKVGSGGLPPFDDPTPPPLTAAQLAADNKAMADLDPTACDPSDADGDPDDDDCGPAATTPTKPQR